MKPTNCISIKCKELTILGGDTTKYYGCAKDIENFEECRKLKKVDKNLRKQVRSLAAHCLSTYINENNRDIGRYDIKKVMRSIESHIVSYIDKNYDKFYFIERSQQCQVKKK